MSNATQNKVPAMDLRRSSKGAEREKGAVWIWVIAFLMIASIAVLSWFIWSAHPKELANKYNAEQLVTTQAIAEGIQEFVLLVCREVDHLTRLPSVRYLKDIEQLRKSLGISYRRHPGKFLSLIRVNEEGKILYSYPPESEPHGSDPHVQEYIQSAAIGNAPSISHPFILHGTQRVIAISDTIHPKGGSYMGKMVALVNLRALDEAFFSFVVRNNNTSVLLIDSEGRVLKAPESGGPPRTDFLRLDSTSLLYSNPIVKRIVEGEHGMMEAEGIRAVTSPENRDPVPMLTAFAPIRVSPEQQWFLALSTPKEEVTRSTASIFYDELALIIVAASFILLGAWLVSSQRKARKLIERHNRELADLQAQTERLLLFNHEVVQGMEEGILIEDERGYITFCNRKMTEILGRSSEELVGKHWSALVHTGDVNYVERERTVCLQHGKNRTELRLMSKEGATVYVINCTGVINTDEGIRILNVFTDITERKKAEESLRESEERFRDLVENIAETYVVADSQGRLRYCSPNLLSVTGFQVKEVLGRSFLRLVSPLDRRRVADFYRHQAKRGMRDVRSEFRIRRKDGSDLWVELTSRAQYDPHGAVVEYRGIARDVAQRRQSEEQMLQTQKMESLRTLIRGMAHGFNNSLNSVLGFSLQMKKYPHDHEKAARYREFIEESALRGAELAMQLSALVHENVVDKVSLDLAEILNDVILHVDVTLDQNIRIVSDITPRLMSIQGDRNSLRQAFINLCMNAADAMPNGGTLTIHASNCAVDQEGVPPLQEFTGSHYIRLSIADTGVGIPQDIRERIYDPFFTTKDPARATGLGLSIVYNTIRSHGGSISFESELEKGTTFLIFLPADARRSVEPVKEKVIAIPENKNKLILLVDDERPMQELGKDLLEEHGYRVIVASNGAEALALYRERSSEITLVVLDVMMPGTDIVQTYLEMKKINPDVKAFFCTGYASDQTIRPLLELENLRTLQKPFQPEDFVKTVREVMATSSASA